MNPAWRKRALQTFTVTAGALPAASLVVSALTDGLGADPVEHVTHATGGWPGGETLPIALYAIEANSPRSYVAVLTLIQLLVTLTPLVLGALILTLTSHREQSAPVRPPFSE